jgi:hypothetical protein
MPQIRVFLTSGENRVFAIGNHDVRVFIGRSDECDIMLADQGASRRHASIYTVDGRWCVQDLGSLNGTLLNGNSIEECQIDAGDRLLIGDTTLLFENGTSPNSEHAGSTASHFGGASNELAPAALVASLLEIDRSLSALGEWEPAKRIASLRESLGLPEVRIVVFGEFSRGKSTLINALVGRIVMPAQLIPTTGHLTRIVFGYKDEVRVIHSDGNVERGGLDKIAEFSSLNIDGVARENIDSIEVAVRSPMLEDGLILIDTPGVNDRDAQTHRAKAAIGEADLVIYLLDARQLLSSAERELAVEWMAKSLRKPVVPVVNFINFLEADERPEVFQIIERWSIEHLDTILDRPWFTVDARGALKHALGDGMPPDDDFRLLRSQLAGLTGTKRENFQRRSRYTQLLAEVGFAGDRNEHVLHRIREDADQLERDRAEERRQLEYLAQRFDATAKMERDRLVLFAETQLRLGLQRLDAMLRTSDKETLQRNAAKRFEERLFEAMGAIEREADGALVKLAGCGCNPPARMAISERLSLDARIQVGDLPVIEASVGQKVAGGVIGAGLGTLLWPGLGTWAGFKVGKWIARKLGETEPDYGAAFCDAARRQWEPATKRVLDVLQAQYDARVTRVKARVQIADQADNRRTKSLAIEMAQREALTVFMEKCRHHLGAGLATSN